MNSVSFCARLLAVAGVSASALAAPVSGQGTWETSLLARDWAGNGVGVDAYYDPDLDITWLADANYAETSGFDADGRMNFSDANAWAAGLTLFGGSDWRLPTLTPVDDTANFNTNTSNNGSTDLGTAKTDLGWGEDSELGYMFYVHLGNKGLYVPNDADPGFFVVQSGFGLSNTGPFSSLPADFYWTDKTFLSSFAWGFNFFYGNQGHGDQGYDSPRAWAVHSGDLIGPTAAPVPLPGALWLLGSALVGVGARARRR